MIVEKRKRKKNQMFLFVLFEFCSFFNLLFLCFTLQMGLTLIQKEGTEAVLGTDTYKSKKR